MDIPTNNTHRILSDAALPSTIEDLKNPTEDYILNLLKMFMSRFFIDMSTVEQPLAEQYDAMMYYHDSDIIHLVNLHAALNPIFDKIYLTDFHIADITNPGQKRFRRQAKFLANFVLYTIQKKSDFNVRMDDIHARSILLEELKNNKAKVLESINNNALHKAKQLKQAKKIESNIKHMYIKLEQNNIRELELDAIKSDIGKENQKNKKLCGSVKMTAGQLSKAIAEMQLEIVQMPEEYQLRLDELEEQQNLKVEERNIMQEAIKEKNESTKQIEVKVNFVQKTNDEFASVKTIYERIKSQRIQLDSIKKKTDSFNNAWSETQNKLVMHKNQVDTEINELQSHREKDIGPLYNSYDQLLSEKKLNKIQLEANKISFNEKCLEKNKLEGDIRKNEEDITVFLQNCQEIYDNEITEEFELQKVWKEQ